MLHRLVSLLRQFRDGAIGAHADRGIVSGDWAESCTGVQAGVLVILFVIRQTGERKEAIVFESDMNEDHIDFHSGG